jgi:hypothetical protein
MWLGFYVEDNPHAAPGFFETDYSLCVFNALRALSSLARIWIMGMTALFLYHLSIYTVSSNPREAIQVQLDVSSLKIPQENLAQSLQYRHNTRVNLIIGGIVASLCIFALLEGFILLLLFIFGLIGFKRPHRTWAIGLNFASQVLLVLHSWAAMWNITRILVLLGHPEAINSILTAFPRYDISYLHPKITF